jgi:hypothetical protein
VGDKKWTPLVFSTHESLFLIYLLRKCVEQCQCEKRFHIVGSYGQNQLVVGSERTNMNSANEFQLAIDF